MIFGVCHLAIRGIEQLWSLAEANREALRILEGENDQLLGDVAAVGGPTLDFAQDLSPVLTGTLRSAHRGEVNEVAGIPYRVLFELFIDPDVINPVTGDRPVRYGPVVHEAFPWFLITRDWFEDNILEIIENRLQVTILGPYETL